MYGILNVSKSGMSSTQNKINVISNNIVNSNTAGYKKLDVEFQDLVRAGFQIILTLPMMSMLQQELELKVRQR